MGRSLPEFNDIVYGVDVQERDIMEIPVSLLLFMVTCHVDPESENVWDATTHVVSNSVSEATRIFPRATYYRTLKSYTHVSSVQIKNLDLDPK